MKNAIYIIYHMSFDVQRIRGCNVKPYIKLVTKDYNKVLNKMKEIAKYENECNDKDDIYIDSDENGICEIEIDDFPSYDLYWYEEIEP